MSLETWSIPLRPVLPEQAAGCGSCLVRSQALFSALPEAHLEQASSSVSHVTLEPGDPVYLYGAPGAAVFTVRSGIVRFERVTAAGGRRIVRLAGQGTLLGQEALVRSPYADDVIACTRVEVCRIPRPSVEHLAQKNPHLVRELMLRWHAALDASHHWTAELACGSARSRMLRLLEVLVQLSCGREHVWLPSRLEMSDMLDLAEETSSRQVARLRSEGVIRSLRPGVATIDNLKLRQALQKVQG